jgi:hypothetical protein
LIPSICKRHWTKMSQTPRTAFLTAVKGSSSGQCVLALFASSIRLLDGRSGSSVERRMTFKGDTSEMGQKTNSWKGL